MKILTRLILIFMLCGTVYGDMFKEESQNGAAASPSQPIVKKKAKKKKTHKAAPGTKGAQAAQKACTCADVTSSSAPLTTANVGTALGAVSRIVSSALSGNSPVVNELDRAVAEMNTVDANAQALAPLIKSQPPNPTSTIQSPQSPVSRLSVMFGGEMWRMGPADQFFPAVAVRYRLTANPPQSPFDKGGSKGDFSVELGGTIPTTFDTTFHQVSETFGPGDSIGVNIASGGEVHLAGVWDFCRNKYATPEISAGLSVASLKNALVFGDGSTRHEVNTNLSPFAEVGANIPIKGAFSAYIGLGWLHFSNTVVDSGNDNFNLFVSAVTIRAMISVRL